MNGIFDCIGTSGWISAATAIIPAIAVAVSIYYNGVIQKQYKEGLKPQLSMRLDNYSGQLYLLIQNVGGMAAKEVKISVKSIERNGSSNELFLDALFGHTFELYPQETTQGKVAFWGANMYETDSFPSIAIDVSYKISGYKKPIIYSRTVTFSKYHDTKVFADVNMDLRRVEDSLKTTARAAVRAANYLDGHQVAALDELDILAHRSLQNDMCSVFGTGEKEPIKNRQATIEFAFGRESNSKAQREPKRIEQQEEEEL